MNFNTPAIFACMYEPSLSSCILEILKPGCVLKPMKNADSCSLFYANVNR